MLERLEAMEARIAAIEARATTSVEAKILAELDRRVEAIEKRFVSVAKSDSGELEYLRTNLRSEIQQAIGSALKKFDRAIEDRIADRVDTLEKAILRQSSVVTTVRQRAVETDMNVQRLIGAVERLFDRPPGAGRPETSLLDPPARKEKTEPVKSQPEIPEPQFESAFRPQILKEGKDPTRRHRIPLTKL